MWLEKLNRVFFFIKVLCWFDLNVLARYWFCKYIWISAWVFAWVLIIFLRILIGMYLHFFFFLVIRRSYIICSYYRQFLTYFKICCTYAECMWSVLGQFRSDICSWQISSLLLHRCDLQVSLVRFRWIRGIEDNRSGKFKDFRPQDHREIIAGPSGPFTFLHINRDDRGQG